VSSFAFDPTDTATRWWFPLAAVVAAGVGILAVVSPKLAIILAIGLIFVGVTLVNFLWGVALFTVLTFLETLPGVGVGVSALKASGGVLVLSWLFAASRRDRSVPLLVRTHPRLAAASVTLVVWSIASALWSADGSIAISDSFRLLQGVFLLFIIFSAISKPSDLRLIVGAYIFGAVLTASIGLSGVTAQDSATYGTTARLTGDIGDPNELAAIIVPALVLAAFCFPVVRGALVRLGLMTAIAICCVAILFTQSRGGIIGVAVAFLAAAILAGPVRARAIAVMLVVTGFGVIYYVLIAPPQALSRITQFSSGGGTGRTDLWAVALRVFRDHPLVGIGAGNFRVVEPTYAVQNLNITRIDFVVDIPHVTHNTYLQVLTDTGVIGGLAFLLIVLAALGGAWRAARAFARQRALQLEVMTRGLLVGSLGTLAAFMFISAEYEKQLWVLLALLASTVTLIRPRLADDSA
jgi:putative inorganic carbon (hco3(-)) transporter